MGSPEYDKRVIEETSVKYKSCRPTKRAADRRSSQSRASFLTTVDSVGGDG